MAWTQTKRMSVQAYTMGLMRPYADGSLDSGDRATVAWLFAGDYSGLTPPPPSTSTNTIKHITQRAFGHKAFEYWRVALGTLRSWLDDQQPLPN